MVSVDLYAVDPGERIVRIQAAYAGREPGAALDRAAMGAVRALAEREGIARGPRTMLLDATTSSVALGHLIEGQVRFWQGNFDAAAAAFREAIEADSQCALAYHRLSVAHVWRQDYGAALAATEEGLALRPPPAPRWLALLQAQHQSVLQAGDRAIAGFQDIVVDDPGNVDSWLGLGESLFHFATTTGHRPQEARPAFERVVALDSTFAPIYSHLVDIALRENDLHHAAVWLRGIRAGDPSRVARAAAIELRRTGGEERVRILRQLAQADRYALSELVALLVHDTSQLALADTVARFLADPDRTLDDQRRAGQYRFAILAALGRWPDALAAWQSTASREPLDQWVVLAALAGHPVDGLAAPMFAWARTMVSDGRAPNFSLDPTHDYQQGFQALVHRATVAGDSAEVLWLLRRLDAAPPSPDPTDGFRDLLRDSLDGRLALLAADTTRATMLLRRAVARLSYRYATFFPLMGMAPQRFLLAQLAARRRDVAEARRWISSFADSWAVADIIYGSSARKLAAELNE
jgi:tetratricopeptide (TPR) repeat protein